MYRTVPVEEGEREPVDNVWLMATGAFLLLLGLGIVISLFKPEWLNFLWLSVATLFVAALAGWTIGFLLDRLFEEFD